MPSIEPFRFIHTGDLHLDSPFVGVTAETPTWIAGTLRDATFRAWERIVQLALDEAVDFLVVAGDVFEHANRTLRGQVAFVDGLRRLADAGIGSYVVTGNHDPLAGWEPTVAWPEQAHRFGADSVGARPVLRGGSEIARVYGISYPVRDVTENLARRFRRDADAPFAIGLLHANVGGQPGHALYAPCSLADLRDAGMDYWALGHVHRPGILSASRPTAVYCGNPQGRDPGEAEARGCYLVSVSRSGAVEADFRALDVVRWTLVSVAIDGVTTEGELASRIGTQIDAAQADAGRAIVARVTLTGRGPLHQALGRESLVEDLRGVVQDALGRRDPFAWVESVRDATRPELDLDALRRHATGFLAEFIRDVESARSALVDPATGSAAAAVAADTDASADEDDGGEPAVAVAGDAPDAAALEEMLDQLYTHRRVRAVLREARPRAEALADLLDRAQTLVVDRMAEAG